MEKRSNPFNFEQVNTEKKFSMATRIITIGIVIMFILIPLAEISPETFLDPATLIDNGCCSCLCPCN